ncbi:MAG: NAD-dependent epimerase/dehydratase family protein [Promethearchaeati archaeon]
MEKKKILLTGASGTVGFAILKKLMTELDKYKIRVFARGSKKNRKLFKPFLNEIELVWGNILDFEKCKEALVNQDFIIHAAALIPPQAYKDEDYTYEVNVNGTRNIISAVKELNTNPKIIYTSSIVVYGDRVDSPMISKKDELKPNDIYGKTKVQAEKIIKDSGLKYIIFRLSYVATVNTLRFDPVLFRMPLESSIEIIHPKDIPLAIVKSIKEESLWNNVYNLGGGEDCRILFRDYLNDILEILGIGRNYLPEKYFAEGGFNCGYISNNEYLQNLLDCQKHSLEDFYQEVREWIGIKRYFARVFRWFIKKYLLSLRGSESKRG